MMARIASHKKNNGCLAYFTMLLILPYFLMFFEILPQREIVNTINGLVVVLLFFSCFVLSYGFRAPSKKLIIFILFFLWVACVNLLNVLFLNSVDSCIYNANALSVIALVYITLVSNNYIFSKESIKNMLLVVVGFAVISSVVNIAINYETILDINSLIKPYDARFTGLFLGRNQFGAFLFLAIVSLVYLKDVFRKNVNKAILGFLVVNLLLTFSRSPILATIIFFAVSKFKINKVKNLLLTLFICCLISLMYLFTPLGEITDKFLIRKEVGSAGRIGRWLNLLNLVVDDPILLLGGSPAGFKELLFNTGFGFAQIDNAYLEILVSYGLIGLLLYVGFFMFTLLYVRKLKIAYDTKRILCAFIFAFFIYNFLEALILFEAGLNQWLSTMLFVSVPRCHMEESV